MKIREFIWPNERIDHIALHGVTPEEFEEVCFGRALVLRGKSEGQNRCSMCLDKLTRGDICFASLSNFPTERAILLRLAP